MQIQLGQTEKFDAVCHDASVAYFNGKKYEEFQMYSQYNTNAETRYKAVQS
jgi:hypothetical protein